MEDNPLQIKQLQSLSVFFDLQVTSDGDIVVTWEDDHVSSFSHDWLRDYGFTADKQLERETNLSLPLVLWNNATMQDKVPKFKFDDVSFCGFFSKHTGIYQGTQVSANCH